MVEPVGNAPTRIVRLKAGCPSIVALTPLKLVLCSPRRLCVLPNVPVGSHLWGQLPIISVLVNSDVFCCSFSMFFKLLRLPLILSPDCSIWCITNKNGASGGYCPHTNILIKSQMPVYCSFTCIKKLYLILSTNYNHLTTLYPPVNNVLKKMVAQVRLELTTRSSSDFCSTLELLSH